jgi:hypothetical protein
MFAGRLRSNISAGGRELDVGGATARNRHIVLAATLRAHAVLPQPQAAKPSSETWRSLALLPPQTQRCVRRGHGDVGPVGELGLLP